MTLLATIGAGAQNTPPRRWFLDVNERVGRDSTGAGTLGNPTAAVALSNGEIVVFDQWARQVNRYDRSGEWIAGYIAPPGCVTVSALGVLHDTIWAVTPFPGPVVLFPPGDVKPLAFAFGHPPSGARPAITFGLLANGLVVGQYVPDTSVGGRDSIVQAPLVTLERTGKQVAVLSRPSVRVTSAIKARRPDARSIVSLAQPFVAPTMIAVRPDGQGFVHVSARIASGGAYEAFVIESFDAAGRLVRTVQYPYEPVPVTAAAVSSILDPIAQAMGEAGRADAQRQLLIPRFFPPVRSAMVGLDGSVWLARQPIVDGERRWTVVDREGLLTAELRVPANLEILYADTVQVLAREAGADGRTWIVRFDVRR